METLGLRENTNAKKNNIVSKLNPVEKLNENQIRIHESIHTMGV